MIQQFQRICIFLDFCVRGDGSENLEQIFFLDQFGMDFFRESANLDACQTFIVVNNRDYGITCNNRLLVIAFDEFKL